MRNIPANNELHSNSADMLAPIFCNHRNPSPSTQHQASRFAEEQMHFTIYLCSRHFTHQHLLLSISCNLKYGLPVPLYSVYTNLKDHSASGAAIRCLGSRHRKPCLDHGSEYSMGRRQCYACLYRRDAVFTRRISISDGWHCC